MNFMVWVTVIVVLLALKIHMSETAHDAVKAYPDFITEPRGETFVKVFSVFSHSIPSLVLLYKHSNDKMDSCNSDSRFLPSELQWTSQQSW